MAYKDELPAQVNGLHNDYQLKKKNVAQVVS